MKKTLITLLTLVLMHCASARMFTPDYGYQVHEIKVNDLNIGYIDEGEGPQTIIFLHGLGGYIKHWQPTLDTLTHHYRCIAVDLPGYGYSQNGDLTARLGDQNILKFFGETVFALMDSLQIDQAVLAGHSMGGQTAILMALRHPQRVSSLVLASPAGFETFTPQEGAALAPYSTPEFLKNQNEQAIRQSFALNFHEEMPPGAEDLIQDRLDLRSTPLMDHYVNVVSAGVRGMLQAPVFDKLSALQMPVLIAYGDGDKLIPNRYLHPTLTTRKVAEQGAGEIPNSTLVMIPEAGHMMPFEKPAEFATTVIKFLNE
ncbi:alpha/beta fold hydrolase [Roseivirga sp. BDSF3-8]|uniref:alpha/beta fold hydrolase n=1 Tax=Roseivirga sp. BDSF3-8 TaxID=3241598 RepID=UPI0035325599